MLHRMLVRRLYLHRRTLSLFLLVGALTTGVLCLLIWQVDTDCLRRQALLLDRVCGRYRRGEAAGRLCEPLCEQQLRFLRCPNAGAHDGKQFVLVAEDRRTGERLVLKLREFLRELPTLDAVDRDSLLGALRSALSATFRRTDADRFRVEHLLPDELVRTPERELPLNQLYSLFQLVQENEYTLTKVLGAAPDTRASPVFLRIHSHCGGLYAVRELDRLLDHSYLLPESGRSPAEKLAVARLLLEFLARFERLRLGFEICDSKIEHYGFASGESGRSAGRSTAGGDDELWMIDADMVNHEETVDENIRSIQNCSQDSDCDFVQCRGRCSRSAAGEAQCERSRAEDNLGRVCRLLLFLDERAAGYEGHEGHDTGLGLLGSLSAVHLPQLRKIRQLCEQSQKRDPRKVDPDGAGKRAGQVIRQLDELIAIFGR